MRRLLPAAAAGLLATTGCFFLGWAEPLTVTHVSDWVEIREVRRPLEEITQMAHDLLVRDGFRFRAFDPRRHQFETEWDVHLSPIWREGFRRKVEFFAQPVDDGSFRVRIRSYREVNDDARNPMLLEEASWVGATIDPRHAEKLPEPAVRLRQLMKHRLFGFSP